MSIIIIKGISAGDLIPEMANDAYFRNELYDTPYLVTNDKTIIYTDCLATCVALAVFAKDENGTCHRIICHCPYAPPVSYIQLEGRIEKHLKSIGKIVELKAKIASFDTFFEREISESDFERGSLIVERMNKLFSFWREENPEFDVEIIQSSVLGVDASGNFLVQPSEEVYKAYLENEENYSNYNTIYNTDVITLSGLTKMFENGMQSVVNKSK